MVIGAMNTKLLGGGLMPVVEGVELPETPLLDELEKGPWPSFVKEIKRAAIESEKAMKAGKRREGVCLESLE